VGTLEGADDGFPVATFEGADDGANVQLLKANSIFV